LPRTPSHNIHAREIAFLLRTYLDVLDVPLKAHEPSGVVTFAFKLAHAILRAFQSITVKGEEDLERARAKMYLYECTREVLAAAYPCFLTPVGAPLSIIRA
jgi:arginyl-tRNA synthetase